VGYISPHAITRDPSVRRGRGAVELDSLSACVWSRLSVCLSVYQFIDDQHCDCPLYKTARVAALPCENVNVRKPAINAMSVCL